MGPFTWATLIYINFVFAMKLTQMINFERKSSGLNKWMIKIIENFEEFVIWRKRNAPISFFIWICIRKMWDIIFVNQSKIWLNRGFIHENIYTKPSKYILLMLCISPSSFLIFCSWRIFYFYWRIKAFFIFVFCFYWIRTMSFILWRGIGRSLCFWRGFGRGFLKKN